MLVTVVRGIWSASLVLAAHAAWASDGHPDAVVRVLRWAVTVENSRDEVLVGAWARVAMPAAATGTQRLRQITADVPSTIEWDRSGNAVLRLDFGTLPSYARRSALIDARVELTRLPAAESLDGRDHRSASRWVPADADEIRRIAAQLSRPSVLETARMTLDWVGTHIDPGDYQSGDLGALAALQQRRGDCTEFAYLAAALLRANGIPARIVSGFVADRDRVLNAADYHDWLQFHDGRAWYSMDANLGSFVENAWMHVVFSVRDEHGESAVRRFEAAPGLALRFE